MPCGAQLHAFSTVCKATAQILNNSCSPPSSKANLYVTENMQGTQVTVESEIDKVLPSQTAQEKTIFLKDIIKVPSGKRRSTWASLTSVKTQGET